MHREVQGADRRHVRRRERRLSGPWYAGGLRFTCTQCGDCCRSHGEYRWVFIEGFDAERLAVARGLSHAEFLAQYTEPGPDGTRVLRWPDEHCVFLGEKGCEVYSARPAQCRTWPFWPETLQQKVWNEEVVPFCPGAGEGRLYSLGEIRSVARGDAETGAMARRVEPGAARPSGTTRKR